MNKKEILNKTIAEFKQIAKDLLWFTDNTRLGPYGQVKVARLSRTNYFRKLRQFENAGLIVRVRNKHKKIIILTAKAKRLGSNATQKNSRNDGLSTIVMFDIPEDKHKARDNFRRYLIKNGYTQIQKSVFVSPFKIFDGMKEFAKELKIESNISIIAGKIEQL